jgi:hypothetical protein
VAEGAGPGVGAGFGFGEFPAVFFHLVVVWAEGVEFGDCGVVVLGPGEGVVDVTVVRVLSTGDEDTFWVLDLDQVFLSFGGPSFGGDQVDELVEMGDPEPPFGLM